MLDGSRRALRISFRFEFIWHITLDFEDIVEVWWNEYEVVGTPSFRLASKLKLLKGDIRKRNMEVFRRVEVRMREFIIDVLELELVAGMRALEEREKVRMGKVKG